VGAVATLLSSHAGDPGRTTAVGQALRQQTDYESARRRPGLKPASRTPGQTAPEQHGLSKLRRRDPERRAAGAVTRRLALSPSEQTRCTAVPALCERCAGSLAACRNSGSVPAVLTASSIGAAKGGGYARYLESKTVEPERGDYYLNPSGEPTQAPGRWLASPDALGRLGIEGGAVDGPDFIALMEGRHPRTGAWLRAAGATGGRGGGIDLTFSAPKSVSAVWALGSATQRRDMADAHAAAVSEAMNYLTEIVPTVRRRVGREVLEEHARGLVAAEYRHTTARGVLDGDAPDPQLHSHVVATCAVRTDGRIVAVASRPVFRAAREVGAAYRSALAYDLSQRGYAIEAGTGKQGRYFEIAGVPRGLSQAFSARSREVARAAERFRAKWGREPERGELRRLKLENRKAKMLVTQSDLKMVWRETAARFEFTGNALTASLSAAQGSRSEGALNERVAARLTERAATFQPSEFRTVLLEQSVGELSSSEALGFSRTMLIERQVLRLESGLMTTQAVRHGEEQIEARFNGFAEVSARDVGNSARAHASDQVAERIGARMSDEQVHALEVITGPERGAIVIGPAGTGKGVVIDAAARAEQLTGHETLGIAVSGSTAQRLGRDSPALLDKTLTLDALVTRVDVGRLRVDERTTIYFDEAGMADTSRLERLTEVVERTGAKLVAIGDGEQLPSIGAGGMFDRLAEIAPCAELSSVHRTRDIAEQRAWSDLRAGRTDKALAHYLANGRVHIADTRDEAIEHAVENWARLTETHAIGELALISDASNKEIARLNARAQHYRAERGQLGGLEVEIPDMHYGVREGDRVAMIDQHYESGQQRIENGSQGEVLEISPTGEVLIEFDVTGQRRTLVGEDLANVRLGYAQHIHRAQGATVTRTLVVTGGWQTSKEPAYVEASRARHGTDWYVNRHELGEEGHDTDRIERFAANMRRSKRQTPSLEHRELPDPELGPGFRHELAPSRSPLPGMSRGADVPGPDRTGRRAQ
jgi:conjugative relaxase-like TrwC/TraI family protein